jgi:hypothetical protein
MPRLNAYETGDAQVDFNWQIKLHNPDRVLLSRR